jgi:hypothetical protein
METRRFNHTVGRGRGAVHTDESFYVADGDATFQLVLFEPVDHGR